MPGTGTLTVTGQLGDVMRESVDAALLVRALARRAARRSTDASSRRTTCTSIFPAGAIPKDGPSAGIAVTLAIASALSGRPVRRDVAMTGEVTLRGKVLEIGGVKEKVLAAYRAGLREVILPEGEREGSARRARRGASRTWRSPSSRRMDEVFRLALLPAASAKLADSSGKSARRGASAEKVVPIERTR